MTQKDKSPQTARQKPQAKAVEKSPWPTGSKLNGAGMKMALGRKIPSGPVGGSGRKTNLARSS
jgi:hypothetical protein